MQEILNFFNTVGFDWPKLLAQIIVFVTVYLILKKYAFGPVIAVLEERKRRIAEAEENYERVKKQLADAEARHEEIVGKALAEAQRLIDEARNAGAELSERKKQEAIAEAARIVEKAREASALEHQKMLAELRNEIGRLVVETTGKVVGRVLTPDDQKRLAEEAARSMSN